MSSAAQQSSGGTADELSEDDVFEVLSNRRRRHAVHTLKRYDHDPMELGDLAEEVAAIEHDVDVAEISYDQRKSVYTALQQSHLPKMDDAGIVEFDKNRGTIEPTPALEELEVYLEVVQARDIPWSEYYLGLSGVSAAFVAASWLGAWPLTLLPEYGPAIFVVVAFLVSATVHTYFSRKMRLGNTEQPPESTR